MISSPQCAVSALQCLWVSRDGMQFSIIFSTVPLIFFSSEVVSASDIRQNNAESSIFIIAVNIKFCANVLHVSRVRSCTDLLAHCDCKKCISICICSCRSIVSSLSAPIKIFVACWKKKKLGKTKMLWKHSPQATCKLFQGFSYCLNAGKGESQQLAG